MTNAPPNERNRRVADQERVPLDVAHQALELSEVRKNHELLQLRVSHGMETVTNTMAGVNQTVGKLVDRVEGLMKFQQSHEVNREAISELRATITGMENNLKSWLEDVVETNNQKWTNYEHNRDLWRQQHEAENEDAIRDALAKLETVREKLAGGIQNGRERWIRTISWGGGAGVLVSIVVAGFLFWLNEKFEYARDVARKNEVAVESNRAAVEREKDKRHEMELYLARGGRVPEQPYQPSKEKTQ